MKGRGRSMYSAIAVANHIIEYEHSKDRLISNLKLQKLLYFVQAQFFIEYEKPCFRDKIEAWSFGPVVPDVYHIYKYYGGMDITRQKGKFEIDITTEDKNIIDGVLDFFSETPIYRLVEITHHQTPWILAIQTPFNNEITNESIQQFFCNS